jgi:acylphosphatase
MADKLLYKILVTGHIQGVGFRWSAASEAGKHGIIGFVKNLSDGSVYIKADGIYAICLPVEFADDNY